MLTAFLILIVIMLYVCGVFLMRALLKESDASDKDSLIPILLWPGFIVAAIYPLIRDGEFKW